MKNSDLRGLDEDLARQTRQTKKMGGPSDIVRRFKKRPEGGISRDGYAFINGKGLVVCKKCGQKKLNGYLEENLCEECYEN